MKNTLLLGLLFVFQNVFCQTNKQELNTTNISDYVVTKKATPETLALFYNLKNEAKTGFAIGQQEAFSGFYYNIGGKSDIKKTTGFDPALIGLDFGFITDNKNNGKTDNWFFQQEQKTLADAKKAYDQGMIVTFCWHFREPYKGEEFYTQKMNNTQKGSVQSILSGGENQDYYKKKLDKIAAVAQKLKGSDGKLIPIIFRPFHEFDGNWFWWGAPYCTPEQYKQLYIFTVNYLQETKGVTNFLYAFSPDNQFNTTDEYLKRYPGDAYVDVLGMDNYGDFDNKGQEGVQKANSKLKILSDLAHEKNKIAAMTETGYQITFTKNPIEGFFAKNLYNALTLNDIAISYVMFWGNNQESYFVPQPNMPDTTDFITFTKKAKAKLTNAISGIYKLNQK